MRLNDLNQKTEKTNDTLVKIQEKLYEDFTVKNSPYDLIIIEPDIYARFKVDVDGCVEVTPSVSF